MKESLRSRIRAGDPEAFRELFKDLAQAVHRHALRVTGDWSATEEAVSLTFLEVWRLRGKLDPVDESVRPWVYGIATNVLRIRNRAARRHREAMERMPAPGNVPDFSDAVAEQVDADRRLTAVKAAVDRLRRSEREVFLRGSVDTGDGPMNGFPQQDGTAERQVMADQFPTPATRSLLPPAQHFLRSI